MALYLCPDCNQHIRAKTICPSCHPRSPRSTSNGLPLALLLGIGCHKTEPAKPEVMALYGGPPVEIIEELEQDTGGQAPENNSTDNPDSKKMETDNGDDKTKETEDTNDTTGDSDENVEEAEPVKPVVKPLYGLPARPDPTIKKP